MGRAQAASALTCAVVLLFAACASGAEKADAVLVVKSERQLYLMKGNKVLAAYSVQLGGDPKGPKQEEGDERTPEGRYVLDHKNVNSTFYKSIHISYPNAQDRENARSAVPPRPGSRTPSAGRCRSGAGPGPHCRRSPGLPAASRCAIRAWMRSGRPWMRGHRSRSDLSQR